ncbi:MAG: ester cyclase [Thermoleophilia bacterium]
MGEQQLSNSDRVRITFEAFNDREFERANDYVHEDLRWQEVPSGRFFEGREGLQAEYKSWLTAFPDGKVEILNMIEGTSADGKEWVIAEYVVRGTNTGPMHGPDGTDIRPSGKAVEIRACDVMNLRDGRVTGGRGYFDTGALAG